MALYGYRQPSYLTCACLLLTYALGVTSEDWTFTSLQYSGTIKECAVACDKLYITTERMGIHLPDKSKVASVKYRISKTSFNQFKAESLIIGDFAFLFIRTKTDGSANLNRELKSYYSLDIRGTVTFTDHEVRVATTRVGVTILDVNDAPPLFTELGYTFDISDSADIFSTVGTVKATDADEGFNAEVYYSFEEWLPEFAVHPTSGDVYITRNLTHSGKRQYTNQVIAANRGAGRQSKVPITFSIVQRNGHTPEFVLTERPPLNGYTSPGTTIMLIKVIDHDIGTNGLIQAVEIISALSSLGKEERSCFSLVPTHLTLNQPYLAEYQLKVTQSLKDVGDYVNITLQAWDTGSPARSGNVIIPLEIISERESEEPDTVYLDIDEGQPVGTPLYYIAPPRNARDVTYRILGVGHAFRIHSLSGVLFLEGALDAEQNFQTNIEVGLRYKVVGVENRFEYTVKFVITIRDENDNSPVFATALEEPLYEDSPIGDLVTIASATDYDADDNGRITYSISGEESLPFDIDPISGEIRLTNSVDYDQGLRVYHIPVRASDRGSPFRRETEKLFTVVIENVNDNKPMFEYDECDVTISQDVAIGSRVYQVSALDIDGVVGELTYSVQCKNVPCDTILQIDSKRGLITTTRDLRGEVGRTVKYLVNAFDGRNDAKPIELSVTVFRELSDRVNVDCTETHARKLYEDAMRAASVLNPSSEYIVLPPSSHMSNDHSPVFDSRFTSESTQYSLHESLAVGSIVTHLVATDEDTGYPGLIQYQITRGNTLGHFAINGSTGALIVFAPLDREKVANYNLTVVAADSAPAASRRSASVHISMTVSDANDNAPRFLHDLFEAYVDENALRGTMVLQVKAQDFDSGSNGLIEFTLITDTPYFAIDARSGRVAVSGVLDRESKDRHVLEVKAADSPAGAEEVLFSSATIIIYVNDVNDNPPVFMKPEYRVRVREDMPEGAVITNLVAHDADLPATGGEVTYKIIKGRKHYNGDKGVEDIFYVDRTTGIVKLMKTLDFEQKHIYRMTIRARDNGTEPLKATCQLVVEVIDVNENRNKPVFEKLAYEGSVSEDVPAGSLVMQVKAVDGDSAVHDSSVTYSIRKGSGIGSFSIDNNGYMRTVTLLDRETTSSYWLTVYAQDSGTVPQYSSVDVYIQVTDVNDNAPEATQPVFYFSVSENSDEKFPIDTIMAKDRDSESDITYSITAGNTQSLFSIGPRSGMMRTTRRTLDRESDEKHMLEVTISDGGRPVSLSSSVQVWITITDVNDNLPTWNSMGRQTVALSRSHDKQKPVYRVIASDIDKGENGSVSYRLADVDDERLWRIDSVTGEMYLRDDWPDVDEMIIQVEALDGGLPQRSNSIHIKVELLDEEAIRSSQAPVVATPNPVYLPEDSQVFEMVDIISAIDADSEILWYSIVDGSEWNGFPMFSIHPQNGIVEVAGKLDYESESEYNLSISVTDGYNTAYTVLRIILMNVNEFQPRLDKRMYEVTISENIKIGSEIVILTATDGDFVDKLTYGIHSTVSNNSYQLFGVNHVTGAISTLRALDHETNNRHELIVKVNDDAMKEFSDCAKVVIHVKDYNDHAPAFVTEQLDVTVYEMSVVGTTVAEVQATDKDKGNNARIQYSLLSGNVGYMFNIDPDQGIISLARPLDMAVRSEYELIVMANDMGNPSLSGTCRVRVSVTVAEERAPSFASKMLSAELPENEPIGTFILALSGESQSTLTYSIDNDDDNARFVVNPNSGILTSNQVFDFEERSLYNMSLTATDIIGHLVSLTVVIHIVDKNDNRPTFRQRMYEGHVSEGSPDGSVILTNRSVPLVLSAQDRDSNLNALLLYSIVEAEARRYFAINPNTGAIRTLVTPDRELQPSFEFSVQVRDQGEESLSAADPARVVVTIDDINDTPPAFDKSSYEATLLIPTYEGVIVHTAAAVDYDVKPVLRYEIVSGNTERKFAIESSTGTVYVQDTKSLRSSYIIGVKVIDGVHEATYILTVRVHDASALAIEFSETLYIAVVTENKTATQLVTIVQPLNLELGEPVWFELLNHRDKFKIGRTSGVLETIAGVALDREVKYRYEVIVRVQLSKKEKLTQVPVIVTVTDVNDNAPSFTKDHYYAATTVSTNRGDIIARLLAIDDDEGENKQIRYEISDLTQHEFKIGRKSGEVSVKKSLEASANREYTLRVTAHDLGEPSLSTETLLTIKVYTESTPNFTQVVYESSIPENIPISSAVTTVSATSAHSNKIIYTIVDGDPNSEFTVHFSTAMNYNGPCTVRVNDDLDFDLRPHYHLKVRAVDVVTGDWSDAMVIVNIQDVNDQKPFFDKLDYYRQVSEAVTIGSEILSINASDADQGINSLIHYKLKAINDDQPHHLMFNVKETGGVAKIHTITPLDHELNTRLDFIIVATDGGNPRLSAQAYIHVLLTDLNDNAPMFEEEQYYVEISDEVKKGQFIAMVSAVDVDESNEGGLMYNIVHGNDGQAFSIDQDSGSVYISRFHQPSMFHDIYMLNISVTDGIYTRFTSLTIQVKAANRHTPEFENIMYNFKVFENSSTDNIIGRVKATDEDEGVYGEVTYILVGEWLQSRFRVHPKTGEIALKQKLDREERDFYMLPLMAQDSGGRTRIASVYVVVEDINDCTPQFTATAYRAAVGVNSVAGTSVLTVSAFDLDSKENAQLVYSIYSDDAQIRNTFTIDSESGEISLIRDLTNNENETELLLFVKVRDSGDVALDSKVLVTVTITSLPVPVFRSDQVQVFLKESQVIGSQVTKVTAEYSGESQLSYRIISGGSVRTNKPRSFVIDSEGRIFTQTSLDSENQSIYELLVEVFTVSSPELVDSSLVVVSPIDANDNSPQFTSDVYTVSVAENIPIGTGITHVSAFDPDQSDTKIAYSFAPQSSSFKNMFMIEELYGYIITLVPLDRETQSRYEFYVQASDEDSRGKLHSQAKVIVDLIDTNDCPPRFPNAKIQAAVNEDAMLGTIVVTVEAVDDDLPEHSTNMYYISNGNDHGHFRIKQTGDIYVSKPLDRESITEYHLEVSATDGVFVSSVMVQIIILDANDNPPVCDRPIYTRVISEDIDPGSLVLAMKASDRDEPGTDNSKIAYSLHGDGANDFAIDSVRGDIRVYKRLDREKISEYHIRGQATDGQGLFCVTDIVFEVTDINDNNPVFEKSLYTHTLPEDSNNNTLLLRVTATDKDTGLNRKVDYSMFSGDTDMFAIDPSNGIIRLIKPIRDTMDSLVIGSSYNLVIAAVDRGESPRTGTAQLEVRISDVNDPPVFQKSLYNVSVSEAMASGTELLQVAARSTDEGLNNVITYRISNGGANDQLFSINSETGKLSTNGTFDYEIVKEYVLNIEAKDKGEPPLSDMCMVTVYITDANDNKPTFSQATYSASIKEDAKSGDVVTTVEAQDLDSGVNAEIAYSIISGDPLNQFVIDSETGYIRVAAPLDREAIADYKIVVEAKDKGTPVQISQANVVVFIGDVNDNTPTFSQKNYTGQIQVYPDGAVYRNTTFLLTTTLSPPTSAPVISTNQKTSAKGSPKDGEGAGHSPLTLTVTDADASPNSGPFKYTILSGDPTNQFRIAEDGRLLAVGFFDMKVQNEYLLQVSVEDTGVPPLSSTTYVRLEVHEAILHPPIVVSPCNFTVVAYEATFPGGVIGYVKATDEDGDRLEYKLVSSRFHRLFSMDTSTGAISSYSLDAGTYVLNVSASDGRYTRYGIIEIKVESITDEMMADAVGVSIAKVTAADFVSLHRRAFDQALLAISSSEFRRIHILSITENPRSPRKKRNAGDSGIVVLVSAESPLGQMIPKARVASLIRDNLETVESMIGGYEIGLPEDNYDCSSVRQCTEDEFCQVQYQITQDKVTIQAKQQSYVSLLTQPVAHCVCTQLDTCANPCSNNPCPSNKYCVAEGSNSYSCECPAGTFGDDCDRRDGSSLAFDGNSYARWTLVNDIKTRLQVKLTFRTKQSDAVLMDARGDKDYSTLEIANGQLQYMFECGSGPAKAITGHQVNDGNWHNVTLERNGNFARLLLDNTYSSEARSVEGTEEINLLDNNVYFGASIRSLPSDPGIIQSGFKGCMKNIQIDRVQLPYIGSNRVGGNAFFKGVEFDCHEAYYGECSLQPCLNGGVCTEQTNGALCSCKGYEGTRCEKELNECIRDNPCAAGSRCENTIGSFICHCPYGKAGPTCHQEDVCLGNPCGTEGRCENVDASLGEGLYICYCTNGQSGSDCRVKKEKVVDEGLSIIQIIYIAGGSLGFLIIIILVIIVTRCVLKKRRNQKKMVESQQSERDLYYPRGSHSRHSHDSIHHDHRAPSPQPPSVPPRPASYTPSVNDTAGSSTGPANGSSTGVNENAGKGLAKNYDLSRDYGSAADDLDRIGNMSVFSPEFREVVARTNPTRTTSTFAALPKLSPLPASVSDTDSIIKPTWDFHYPSNGHASGRDMSSGNGSDRPSHKTVITATPQHKSGSKNSSKAASITNGSFVSLPQEDEVGIAPPQGKTVISAAGRYNRHPQLNVAKAIESVNPCTPSSVTSDLNDLGYHWDTSDWVPMSEDGDMRERHLDRHGYPAAARLLSMSEVDDSEYVGDSELDDDVIPGICGANYTDGIMALQAQYKLDYDLPEINVPKVDRNHYLPSHGTTAADRKLLAEGPQSSLARVISIPAVPQRSASLGYSTDDIAKATAEETNALEGYTSMEAGDSQSELSENICDIESDCEDDMEDILARVKNKHSSNV